MSKKLHIITLACLFTITACSRIDSLLPVITELGLAISDQESLPTDSPSPEPITPTVLSSTPTANPSPTLTLTLKPTRTPYPTSTLTPTLPPIIRVGPDNLPDYVNQLTGMIVVNPGLLDRRPIAVKVPNYPQSVYPQSGLSMADQIFEYHLEQGLTRFIAIFYGNDTTRVGPIRSGRNFDAHIVQMYNAAYVFNLAYREEGNEPLDVYGYLESLIDKRLLVVEPPSCTSYMCRDDSILSYNNLFGNTFNISKLITQRGIDNGRQDLATNFFYSLGGRGRQRASVIHVDYSYANYAYWQYNQTTNQYYRYQGNIDLTKDKEPEYILLTDANNDQPIVADNVVILFVPHKFIYKSGLSEVFDIQLTDRGDAYIFRNGSAFEAIWERREVNKPLYLLTPEGLNFPLKPGITFFQVLNTTSTIEQANEEWTFTFERPEEPEE
jgi:hypothetical protein